MKSSLYDIFESKLDAQKEKKKGHSYLSYFFRISIGGDAPFPSSSTKSFPAKHWGAIKYVLGVSLSTEISLISYLSTFSLAVGLASLKLFLLFFSVPHLSLRPNLDSLTSASFEN